MKQGPWIEKDAQSMDDLVNKRLNLHACKTALTSENGTRAKVVMDGRLFIRQNVSTAHLYCIDVFLSSCYELNLL
jgi:hypothetical protein